MAENEPTGAQQEPTEEPLDYETYLKYRFSLDTAELEVSGRYDKWVLTLSGGALGLSITFLDKIAKNPIPETKFYLACAWAFFVISLVLGLISLLTSQSSIREGRDNLDKMLEKKPLGKVGLYSKVTNALNWLSGSAFVIGTVLLCVFSFKNAL
jgi:preprotein translocase subunit SecG